MPNHFDAIIIGAGQAGPSLAGRLTKAGLTVAMIERKLFGGTCVNTGCIPTKTLIATAYAVREARRAEFFGFKLPGPIVMDMNAVKARKDTVVAASRDGIEKWLRTMERCTVYTGHARFESPNSVRVNDDLVTAERIFLNVGARANVPNMPGLDQVNVLTNTSMLELDTLPRHLVIVGGGSYIGLEFGQMFRRFGSQVSIVEMGPRLVQREDEDVSAAIKDFLEKEGIRIRLNAECIHFSRSGEDSIVHVDCKEDSPEIPGSHILLAVGRRPNTDDLGLDKAGLATDAHGFIPIDDQLRTTVPSIWALGDCNPHGGFTHTAYNDFEIAAANILDNDPRRVSDRIHCYALYTDPPLGRIGLTEAQVRKSGKLALIGTRPMTKVGRAVEKGETEGFMKILVDAKSKHLLGASILGTGGDEAVHCLLDTMYANAPYSTVQRAVHIHPTVSELIPTVLGDLKPLS